MPRKKASHGPESAESREALQFPRMNLEGTRPEPTSGGPGTDSQDEAEAGRLRVAVQLRAAETSGEEYIFLARDAICCPTCEEPYKTAEPRTPCILPCFHTYCRLCLEGWAKEKSTQSGGVSCPTCCAACPTAVEALPLNYALMNVIEAEHVSTGQTRMECQDCDENCEATHFCQVCNLLLCAVCGAHHGRSKKTKHHVLKNFSPEVIYRALLAQKLFTNFMSSGEASAAPAWNCHIQLQAETEGSGSIKTLNAEQLKEARRLHRNMRKRRRYHANKVHNKPVEAIKNLECGGTGTHMNKRRKPDG